MDNIGMDETRLIKIVFFWKKFFRVRVAGLALIVLFVIILSGIFSPLIAPFDYGEQNIMYRLSSPMTSSDRGYYLLGSDALGRDIFSQLLYGARVSLMVGGASVFVAGTIGVGLGLLSGYFGGWPDTIIMRWTDVQLAVPFLVLALAVVAALGSGLVKVIIVLGITGWVQYARLVRAEVLQLREEEFVLAAHAIGLPNWRIILRHIFPNVTSSILVMVTLQIARFILMEASLSFLGLGVPVEVTTWGGMVAEGRDYLSYAPWVASFPGLTIFITVLSINLVGDRLRDLLDPKLGD